MQRDLMLKGYQDAVQFLLCNAAFQNFFPAEFPISHNLTVQLITQNTYHSASGALAGFSTLIMRSKQPPSTFILQS
jgi:hypothetical protein